MDTPAPKRTLAQCHAIMTGPGGMHEMEYKVINGHMVRVYKKAPHSLRHLWLASRVHGQNPYIIYKDERLTFAEAHQQAAVFANLLRDEYGVRKGDRVAIVMRNLPEYVVAFWVSGEDLGAGKFIKEIARRI
jgi:long-chain acyl-CoA synthetase